MGWIVPSTRKEKMEARLQILLACTGVAALVGISRILPRWALWLLTAASLLVFLFWVRLRLFRRRGGE